MNKSNWYFIGPGAVGSTLVRALREQGQALSGICVRRAIDNSEYKRHLAGVPVDRWPNLKNTADAAQIGIAVADRDIAGIAKHLAVAGIPLSGKIIFHLSGAFDSGLLGPLKRAGAHTGSLHFMQSFNSRFLSPDVFKNITFAGEGDAESISVFENLANVLGGRFLKLSPGKKAFYHLAGVSAANFFAGLLDYSTVCLEEAGIDQQKAAAILVPIAKSVLENFEQHGAKQALTGPLQRGDVQAIKNHVARLSESRPDLLPLYSTMSNYLLEHLCSHHATTESDLKKIINGIAVD